LHGLIFINQQNHCYPCSFNCTFLLLVNNFSNLINSFHRHNSYVNRMLSTLVCDDFLYLSHKSKKYFVMENKPENNNSKVILAWVLIVIGVIWILRKIGFYFEFPHFYFQNIFFPFKHMFQGLFDFIFSWQIVLIIVGLILMAGKRSAGIVLIVIGGIFMLPKLFIIPGITFSMFFPVLLVGLGIAMIVRRI